MTDEGAKALAAALEKLAEAIRVATTPVVITLPPTYPVPQQQPAPPWQSPFWYTTYTT